MHDKIGFKIRILDFEIKIRYNNRERSENIY